MTYGPEQICATYDFSMVMVRWGALILDVLLRIVVIVTCLVLTPLNAMPVAISLCVLFYVIYYPMLEGIVGQTFGKFVVQIRVVNGVGDAPGLLAGIARTVPRVVEINPFLFGGIPAAIIVSSNAKRRRLGDMLAGTFVVRCKDLISPPAILRYHQSYAEAATAAYDLPTAAEPAVPQPRHARRWTAPACWAVLMLIPTISLLYSGYRAKREAPPTTPSTVTCEYLLSPTIKPGWYHVTDVPVDLAEARYSWTRFDSTGTVDADTKETQKDQKLPITEVILPISLDEKPDTYGLVISTRDDRTVTDTSNLREASRGDQKKFELWAQKNIARIVYLRDFTGMVVTGATASDITTATSIEHSEIKLAPLFTILKEGEEPYRTSSKAALIMGGVFGLIAAICAGLAFARRSS